MARRLKFFEDGCAAWAEFQAALTPLEKPGTLREQLERLRQVLKTLRFDPAAGSMSDPEADSGSLWKILDGLATAATHTLVDEELSTRDFFRLVESALDEAEVDSATVAGGVRALTVAEARGLDFDYVFLLGLNDGVFPRADAENPLIPDDALPALNRALRASLRRRADLFAPSAPGSILRSRLERRSEEPFLFFLALSMPSRGVTLSYSRQDGAGGALAPSPYVGEVLRLLQDLPNPARQDSDAAIGDIFEERAFFSRVATEPGLIESTQALQRYRPRVESIRHRIEIERHRTNYLALPTREEVFRQRRASGEAGDSWITRATPSAFPEKQQLADSYNGRVDGDPLLRRMLLETNDARPRDWSASQLSDLASCGFRYFASRILRLDAPEDTDHEQTRLETGDLVHRLLKEV
jgi:ATP-dependent helicase/DNAse subunit B